MKTQELKIATRNRVILELGVDRIGIGTDAPRCRLAARAQFPDHRRPQAMVENHQLLLHVAVALNIGITRDEIQEAMVRPVSIGRRHGGRI